LSWRSERCAAEVLDAISEALLAFTEGLPPFDDVTLVVIKRTEGTENREPPRGYPTENRGV